MSYITVETETFRATKCPSGNVHIYQKKQDTQHTWNYLGVGWWDKGIIRGSGINCGILVQLEKKLNS